MNSGNSGKIVVVDYGMGNLRSVEKAFHKVGCRATVSSDPDAVRTAAGVVLPGVGAFGEAVRNLEASGLKLAILEALDAQKPYLGICLGLQLLFSGSEEDEGGSRGFGTIEGRVRALPASDLKVPHMGWNRGRIVRPSSLFEGVPDDAHFYFVHSYCADPRDTELTVLRTEYGVDFASAIQWGERSFAVQFHPEKSSRWGLKILENFGRIVDDRIPGR